MLPRYPIPTTQHHTAGTDVPALPGQHCYLAAMIASWATQLREETHLRPA